MNRVGDKERLPQGRLQDLQKRFSQAVELPSDAFEFGRDYRTSKPADGKGKGPEVEKNSDIPTSHSHPFQNGHSGRGTASQGAALNEPIVGEHIGVKRSSHDNTVVQGLGSAEPSLTHQLLTEESREGSAGSTGRILPTTTTTRTTGEAARSATGGSSADDGLESQWQLRRPAKAHLRGPRPLSEAIPDLMDRGILPPKNIVARQTCVFEANSSEISEMLTLVDKAKKDRPWKEPAWKEALSKQTPKKSPLTPVPHIDNHTNKLLLTDFESRFKATETKPKSKPASPTTPPKPGGVSVASSKFSASAASKALGSVAAAAAAAKPANKWSPKLGAKQQQHRPSSPASPGSPVSMPGKPGGMSKPGPRRPSGEEGSSSEESSLIREKKKLFEKDPASSATVDLSAAGLKVMGLSFGPPAANGKTKQDPSASANNSVFSPGIVTKAGQEKEGVQRLRAQGESQGPKSGLAADFVTHKAEAERSLTSSPVASPPAKRAEPEGTGSASSSESVMPGYGKKSYPVAKISSESTASPLRIGGFPKKPDVKQVTRPLVPGPKRLDMKEQVNLPAKPSAGAAKRAEKVNGHVALEKETNAKPLAGRPKASDDIEDVPLRQGPSRLAFATADDQSSSDQDSSQFSGYAELRLAVSGQTSEEPSTSVAGAKKPPPQPPVDSSSEDEDVYSPPPARRPPPTVAPPKPPRTFAHDKFLQSELPHRPFVQVRHPTGTSSHTYEDMEFNGGEYASLRFARGEVPYRESTPPPALPARLPEATRMQMSYSTSNLADLADEDMSWRVPQANRQLGSTSSEEDPTDMRSHADVPEEKKSALKRLKQFLNPRQRFKHPGASNLKKYASAECISQAVKAEEDAVDSVMGNMHSRNPGKSGTLALNQNGKFVKNKKHTTRQEKSNAPISKLASSRKPGASQPKGIAEIALNHAIVAERERIFAKLVSSFSVLHSAPILSPTEESSTGREENPYALTIPKRLKHCASVRNIANYSTLEKVREYTQLYHYALTVSIRKNEETSAYEPYVKFKFPPKVEPEKTAIPLFCFPDAEIWHRVQDQKSSEAYSFVLTDVNGSRQYGYCRRVLSKGSKDSSRMPDVFCIVSPLNAFKFFEKVLDEVESRSESMDNAEEFLKAAYGRPLPNPGKTVTIRAVNDDGELGTVEITRAPDSQREGLAYNKLLQFLSVGKIVKVFSAILLERNVIFCADKLSHLSQCIHAFASLLYPFTWEHTFIPLLPSPMMDIVCAPTPFIVGVLSHHVDQIAGLEREPALIINLDTNKFLEKEGDEHEILPKKVVRALTSALNMAKSDDKMGSEIIMETFLRFFVEIMGNCGKYITKDGSGMKTFQKEEFIRAAESDAVADLLRWFTETQMFSVYINQKLEDVSPPNGVFERRRALWNQERTNPKSKKPKRWRKW